MSDDRETVSVPTTPSGGDPEGRLQTEVRQEDAPTAVNPVVKEPVAEATATVTAAAAPAAAKPAAGAVPTRPRTGRVRTDSACASR